MQNSGSASGTTLSVGSDPAGHDFGFKGYLDEIRLWSVARTSDQILTDQLQLGDTNGLASRFRGGGDRGELVRARRRPVQNTSAFGLRSAARWRSGESAPRAALSCWSSMASLTRPVSTPGPNKGSFVTRISPGFRMPWATFVHDDENLYIGVKGLGVNPAQGGYAGWVGVFSHPRDLGIDLGLDPQLHIAVHIDPLPRAGLRRGGDGSSYSPCLYCLSPDLWDATSFHVEFSALFTAEVRLSRDLLGDWSGRDGLAIGHFLDGTGPRGGIAPLGAIPDNVQSWASITYSDTVATTTMATFSGRVVNARTGSPIANQEVKLRARPVLVPFRTTRTLGDGTFTFADVPVPDSDVWLEIATDPAVRYDQPVVAADANIRPTEVNDSQVLFPRCRADACQYSGVRFKIRPTPGALAIVDATPETAPFTTRVRDLPAKSQPPGPEPTVRIRGQNLHEEVDVALFAECDQFPNYCESKYPAEITDRATDMTWVEVRVPSIAGTTNELHSRWFWGIHDRWARASRGDEWKEVPGDFRFIEPEYPLIHGFEFVNQPPPDASFGNDFASLFRENAYLCVAGCCASPDPLYFLYYLIYAGYIDYGASGSCHGMSATSLVLESGHIRAEDLYPAPISQTEFPDYPPNPPDPAYAFLTAPTPGHFNAGAYAVIRILGMRGGS